MHYRRFYYNVNSAGGPDLQIDEVILLKKVINFLANGVDDMSPFIISDDIFVFKVNSVMKFNYKVDKPQLDPLGWLARHKLTPKEALEIGRNYYNLPANYNIVSFTKLKSDALYKLAGDRGFVDNSDVSELCTLPMTARYYDNVDFDYKEGDDLKQFSGKLFVIDGSGYIPVTRYMKIPCAPKPFDYYLLDADDDLCVNYQPIQGIDVSSVSDIKFDDMLSIFKEDALGVGCMYSTISERRYYGESSYCGFLITNIEKVDSAELDKHFSHRIKGRFVYSTRELSIAFLKTELAYNSEWIGSAMDLKTESSLVTLELGDTDDLLRVYPEQGMVHASGLYFVKLIEESGDKPCDNPVWPVCSVYRQFMQIDKVRREAIDTYIDKLPVEKLTCIEDDGVLYDPYKKKEESWNG